MYVSLDHFAVQLKLTQYGKSVILQDKIKVLKKDKVSQIATSWD